MTLTTEWQELATFYVGNTGYGDVYLNLMGILVSQDTANNKSRVGLGLRIYTSNGTWSSQMNDTLDGNYQDLGYQTFSAGHEFIHIIEKDITHNDDGTYSGSFDGSIWTYFFGTTSGSASFTLPTIPRYVNITSFNVSKRDETSVKISYGTDAPCDYAWYSVNNGSWQGLPNTGIISGLSANTTYNFKIRLRRTDSQLTTDSSTVQQTTYNYPYCASTPNFSIGDGVTLSFYNPLGRTFNFNVIANGTQINYTWSANGTSKVIFDSESTQKLLYATIPNATSATYQVKVTYGSSVKTRNNGNTYTIKSSLCTPTFGDFEIENIDSVTKNITGNNQYLVDNYSTCRFKISTSNKAVAKNSATIVKYICEWGSSSNYAYENTSQDIDCDVAKGSGNLLKVTAVDSRGLSVTKTKNCNNVAYVNAVINELDTQRKNGIDAQTYLKLKAVLWNGNWNNNEDENYDNILKYVAYRVLIDNIWSDWYDITETFNEKMSTYDSGNSKIIEVDFNDELEIHSNGSTGGFTSGQSFTIQVLIKDGTSETIFEPTNYQAILQGEITDGQIGMARYKDRNGQYHYGINGMPDSNFTFNVAGNYGIDGLLLFEVVEE